MKRLIIATIGLVCGMQVFAGINYIERLPESSLLGSAYRSQIAKAPEERNKTLASLFEKIQATAEELDLRTPFPPQAARELAIQLRSDIRKAVDYCISEALMTQNMGKALKAATGPERATMRALALRFAVKIADKEVVFFPKTSDYLDQPEVK